MTAIDDRAQASARMSEQGIEPAENRRKPGGQCLAACPPGLTADTTVFAIDGPSQMRVRRAGGQGGVSRGGGGVGGWGGGLGVEIGFFAMVGPAKWGLGGEGGKGIAPRGVPCKRHLQ